MGKSKEASAKMFHVIERRVWRRILIVGLLCVVAGALYWASNDATLSVYSESLREWLFGERLGTVTAPGDPNPQVAAASDVDEDEEAVAVLFGLGGGDDEAEEAPEWGFDSFRYERDRSDARLLEELMALLQTIGAETSPEVQMEVVRLLSKVNREAHTEALLRAQGLGDALVVVTSSGAFVVVEREITQSEASQIGDIVARVAELPLDRITISDGIRWR